MLVRNLVEHGDEGFVLRDVTRELGGRPPILTGKNYTMHEAGSPIRRS
jgi:hypothetical protein